MITLAAADGTVMKRQQSINFASATNTYWSSPGMGSSFGQWERGRTILS
jgi:hypothetical protein